MPEETRAGHELESRAQLGKSIDEYLGISIVSRTKEKEKKQRLQKSVYIKRKKKNAAYIPLGSILSQTSKSR
jgi:hypothetical protein